MHKATSLQPTSKIIILLLVPIAIYAIPYELWFSGESICLIKILTGRECWGCGITRAIVSALHLDFVKAFEYHKMVVVVLPILAVLWCGWLLSAVAELRIKREG